MMRVSQIVILIALVVSSWHLQTSDIDIESLVASLQPTSISIRTHTISTTPQNNPIKIFLLSETPRESYTEYMGSDAILITSMMHPREDTALEYTKELVRKIVQLANSSDPEIGYLLSRAVVIVMPVVNVDGVQARLNGKLGDLVGMRKNMNLEGSQGCQKAVDKGVDINRNFDYKFGTVFSSRDPCSQEYHGKQPFSEPESKAIQTIFRNFRVVLNLDIHSYGNVWIYPYASESNPHKISSNPLYPHYQHIFKILQNLNISYDNCYNSLKYVADGVYIDWALEMGSVSFAIQFGDGFKEIGNHMDRFLEAAVRVLAISGMAFQYSRQIQEHTSPVSKLCVKSFSVLQHNIILMIDQQVVQGKRLRPKQTICFTYNLQNMLSQTKNIREEGKPHIFIKMGHTKLKKQIKIQQLPTVIKNKDEDSVSTDSTIFDKLKIVLFIIGALCLISSICGISVFFQKNTGINIREQETVELKQPTQVPRESGAILTLLRTGKAPQHKQVQGNKTSRQSENILNDLNESNQ